MRLAADNGLADILVVDDTSSDRQFLSEVLVAQGYRVVTAGSGTQALEEINLAIPDLVLLDINMPDMDGFEVCRQLKQSIHFARIPVIFISSYDDTESKVAAFNCGGIDYVTKPFMVAEVKARIRAHLEMKRVRDQLDFQAGHDPLTGLPNRNLLTDRLHQALNYAERYGSQVAVAYIDLDKFKEVNDCFGHQAGDRLLVEVSRRLLACVRELDTVARLGGDEFVIVFYGQSDENATGHTMQRILERIAEPFVFDGLSLNVSCSIGFTVYPQDGRDVDTLLRNADTAMYRAKELGRNNFQFYTSELNIRINERMTLEKSLRQALERDEFLLHYQPRIELRGGRVVGLEALIRWRHPERGLLPPLSFIPVAEQAGLIGQVGDWVVRAVCRQQSAWQQKGVQQMPVSINISAAQFLSPGFAQSVAAVLQETNIDASLLELEFRESLLMNDPAISMRVLRELRDIGVGLSIDDFGTGFSNLSYLKQFAVDRLKLDPSFVCGIENQPDDLALAEAVISVAHSLQLKVAAEGIERGSQLALLADRG
ncbi:MAG TPA: EAL domain-containing protein, partial [Noviherbaspirillum sp.]